MDFHLFRLYTFPSNQFSLFGKERTRVEVLRTTFERLAAKKPVDQRWNVGNARAVNYNVTFFRIGKIRIRHGEQYVDGKFIDYDAPDALSTYCFIDFEEGLLAIAKRSMLGRDSTQLVAHRLREMLQRVFKGHGGEPEFEIESIPDPVKFLQQLEDASYIRKFFVTFLRPNPINVDQLLTAPMNSLIKVATAERTHVEIMGPDLKKEVLTEITRDAAARGADASAHIVKGRRRVFIKLRESSATVNVAGIDSDDADIIADVWSKIERSFNRVRGSRTKDRRKKR